jgi:hypothetical protein
MAGTRKVRMIVGISGYRHDDRPWPPAHTEIVVPDWEADDLIRGGNAVPCEQDDDEPAVPDPVVSDPRPPSQIESEAAAVREPELPARAKVRAEATVQAGDKPEDEPGDEPEVAAAPSPGDPKQAWIDYAVTQGADVHQAGAMTKADLMSRYGGRL